ncbi:MAG: hypothetical protein LBE17_00305 [Treponema sp.]|jgi:hypothetical protein|nr:hypothetical protein [Treponema sp.]
MKKSLFLVGIIGMLMICALVFTGCGDGAGGGDNAGDGDGGGVSSNPLLGTWANDLNVAAINTVLVFTETASTVAENAKLAYYAANLTRGSHSTSGNDFIITFVAAGAGAAAESYRVDVSGAASGTIVLADYIPAAGAAPAANVTFKRAAGTSGSGTRGIWISDLASNHARYTILLIGDNVTRPVLWARGADAAAPNYRLSVDAGLTYISWNSGAIVQYTKNVVGNNVSLSIPPPGGGAAVNLLPLSAAPTF